jgi:endonuclease YncB( thermonuclease family)
VASRRGLEPLTPGLGNLCSILLSYRDFGVPPEAAAGADWTNGPEAGTAHSMHLRFAHRLDEAIKRVAGRRLAAVLGVLLATAAPGLAACGTPSGTVQAVAVDERLDVTLADGRMARLAGLDPPRSTEAAGAARDFLAALVVGRDAELDLLGKGQDRWGRIVADLSLSVGQNVPKTSAAMALLAAGHARVRPEFETRSCAAARLAVEDDARQAGLGLWAATGETVISSSDLVGLHRRNGRFVVVEGSVRRVGFGRSRLYLDLGPRDGLTIVVARKLGAGFARAGRPLESLTGRTIRARGALDARFGLRIEVSEPEMIEIVRPSGAPEVETSRP